MGYSAADYAEAIWSYTPRTLTSGSAGSPSGYAQQVAEAVWTYSARTLNGTPLPVILGNPPNPAETVWRIGPGGAVTTPSVSRGFAGSWAGELRNDGEPAGFELDAVLDAKVWRGDDEAPLFSPAVAWAEEDGESLASEGRLVLSVSAGQTATLAPGAYRLQVGVTVGGVRFLAYDGTLEVGASPGAGEAPKVYCSYDEMKEIADRIDLVFPRESGRSGYLEERADGRAEVERRTLDGYRPRGGFNKRRVAAYHPIYGHDRPDPTLSPPTPDDLAATIAANGLVFDRRLGEMTAIWAVARVIGRLDPRQGDDYRQVAADLRDRFEAAWSAYKPRVAGIETPEGTATIEIAPGSTITFIGLPEVS